MKKFTVEKCLFWGSIVLAIAIVLIFEVAKLQILKDSEANRFLTSAITRLVCGMTAIFLIRYLAYDCLTINGINVKTLLLFLPCLLVPLNNFPWLDWLWGNLSLVRSDLIFLFALECLSVGFFEEVFFRGLVLSICLERCKKNKKGMLLAMVISSAVFGLFHLTNLFGGGNVGAVLLQIGYSFLFGLLLSFALVITKSVWLCVIMHAAYNFGGLFFPTLGSGSYWGTGTVILTVVVSIVVLIYALAVFYRREYEKFHILYRANDGKNLEN